MISLLSVRVRSFSYSSSKEQPLVFGIQRCCAASVMGLALEMFQLEEKACELLRGFKFELGMLVAQPF